MRLWVWSDVHLEMQTVRFPERAPEDCDVLVIAGDLAAADEVEYELEFLHQRYGLPIVFVPGNHEFYVSPERSGLDRGMPRDRARMGDAILRMREAGTPIHFLDDSEVIIDGVRFIGATLWTDFAYDPEEALSGTPADEIARQNMVFARGAMMDYQLIPHLHAAAVLDMHERSRDFIRAEFAKPHSGPTVVVTHHVPHPLAEPEFYKGAYGNCYFTSSEAAFGDILEGGDGPDLWIYGHTHQAVDTEVGRTRLLCNPFGYKFRKDEMGNGFFWELTADV